MNKFHSVKIDKLTDSECRGMPSFIEHDLVEEARKE